MGAKSVCRYVVNKIGIRKANRRTPKMKGIDSPTLEEGVQGITGRN